MPQIYGKASHDTFPSEVAGGAQIQFNTDEFGNILTRSEALTMAERGVLYRAMNTTPGTGIAMGIQTAFSDTANALAILRNTSSTKKIIPIRMRLINTVAGATTTSSRLVLVSDTANRYSSGGTDLTANIVNSDSGNGAASIADLRFGALTASAAVAKRQLANVALKTQAAPCWTIGDEVVINFGLDADPGATSGAATLSIVKNIPPVVLRGQNHSLLFHMYNPANATTAPSWECEFSWLEL